jgi:mRNA interferase RelE/StbE
LERLDKPTKNRIHEKLRAIADAPTDLRLSYPLVGVAKRSTRIGRYRVLFEIDGERLIVSDIGPRGQIYRHM